METQNYERQVRASHADILHTHSQMWPNREDHSSRHYSIGPAKNPLPKKGITPKKNAPRREEVIEFIYDSGIVSSFLNSREFMAREDSEASDREFLSLG